MITGPAGRMVPKSNGPIVNNTSKNKEEVKQGIQTKISGTQGKAFNSISNTQKPSNTSTNAPKVTSSQSSVPAK